MSMLEDAQLELFKAAKYAEIDLETIERLRFPKQTIEAAIPVRLDDGSLKVFKSFVCLYDNTLGLYKGGIRISKDITNNVTTIKDIIEKLAFSMVLKSACAGINFGGAKSAIIADIKTLSNRELERLSKAFVDTFHDIIGEKKYVPASDLNVNSTIIGWMAAQYRNIMHYDCRSAFTSKPVALGGLAAREAATALGGWYILKYLMKIHPSFTFTNIPTVAIMGAGQVGGNLAQLCYDNKLKVVAFTNENGGVYNQNGLDINLCRKNLAESCGKSFGDVGIQISNDDLLVSDVDILCPAAIENVISKNNVDKLKARTIFEMANSPVTKEADDYLNDKGITIIPDIIANQGGLCVSFMEWAFGQNNDVLLDDNKIQNDLRLLVERSTEKMIKRHFKYKISCRTAAYATALSRIGSAQRCLGVKSDFVKSS